MSKIKQITDKIKQITDKLTQITKITACAKHCLAWSVRLGSRNSQKANPLDSPVLESMTRLNDLS